MTKQQLIQGWGSDRFPSFTTGKPEELISEVDMTNVDSIVRQLDHHPDDRIYPRWLERHPEDPHHQSGQPGVLRSALSYVEGKIQAKAQNHDEASYAPRVKKEDARIDWNRPAPQIHNRIRAFNPWPTAFADFRGEWVKIWRSQKMKENGEDLRASGRVGTIAAVAKDEIIVECGRRTFLSLQELQLPNRKRVSARDFVNGTSLRLGELLT